MDGQAQSISSQQLYQRLGTASAPILLDVRRQDAFGNDDRLIIGALHRPPEEVERWRKEFSASRPIVAYCSHGREVSQGVATALRGAGVEAVFLKISTSIPITWTLAPKPAVTSIALWR